MWFRNHGKRLHSDPQVHQVMKCAVHVVFALCRCQTAQCSRPGRHDCRRSGGTGTGAAPGPGQSARAGQRRRHECRSEEPVLCPGTRSWFLHPLVKWLPWDVIRCCKPDASTCHSTWSNQVTTRRAPYGNRMNDVPVTVMCLARVVSLSVRPWNCEQVRRGPREHVCHNMLVAV